MVITSGRLFLVTEKVRGIRFCDERYGQVYLSDVDGGAKVNESIFTPFLDF